MLRDIFTVYFIVAGCLLLWLNIRPQKIVHKKDDDVDVAHPHPEQNASDDDPAPVPHLVAEGAESLTRAEDGDARPEGDLVLEADLQRKEMARNARTGSTPDDRKRAFVALIDAARSPAACSRAKRLTGAEEGSHGGPEGDEEIGAGGCDPGGDRRVDQAATP